MKFLLRVKLMVIGAVLVAMFLSGAAFADDDFIRLCSNGAIEQIEKAINSGVNVNAEFSYEGTALMLAARDNPDPRVIMALLRAGAKINAKNKSRGYNTFRDGETALTTAAANNPNPEVITTLVKAGAELNVKVKGDLETAVISAVYNPNPEVMTSLIEAGADINATNKDGMTALMWAARRPSTKLITALVKAGADLNAENRDGQTAFDIYSRHHFSDVNASIVKLLTPTMMSDRKFFELCTRNSLQEVEEAIKFGANVNAKKENGNTPLFAANSEEIYSVLIKAGADVNAKNNAGVTPLIRATGQGNLGIMKILLANGASPEGTAEYAPNEEVVDFLSQYSECEEYFDGLIEFMKNSYWGDYSEADGYAPLGEAFEEFFGKPKWVVVGGNSVVFTGTAKSNGKTAMFKVRFNKNGQSIRSENYTINGNKASWNDLLAAVYLN